MKPCLLLTLPTLVLACSTSSDTTPDATPGGVPAVFDQNYTDAVTRSATTTTVTLSSLGIPDHETPYWDPSHPLYVPQTAGKTVTPGHLMEQTFVMTIPISPVAASSKEATSLGPIGMAINGVAIYNDREGGNVPVNAQTLSTFDDGGGHSGPGGLYHYHFEPSYIANDNDALIGHLRDGFPIYGRRDQDASYPTDLDANGGHVGPTTQYPDGIYHYHCSTVNYLDGGYYIIKAGAYHGTKGTFTF